ncbi:PAS domain-containing protein [Qipengyuania flava]|uniref:PAS domain-containing protein n=1 Tax=Qipengyuania flava TaxID=192812 RepID=UPI0035CCD636
MDRFGGFFGSRDTAEDIDEDIVDEADADLEPPPSPVGQDERRMQVRAYNHWASLLGDLAFPHISDLEPESLDDFGPYSVLLDLSDDIEDPKVGFVGSELAEEAGHDGDLALLSNVPSRSVLSRITDHYMQIIANQAPIGFEAEFTNERGATVLYRGILLPYSSDNETIDFIYGVINWKEMADQQTADELLLAIDQALGDDEDDAAYEDTVETAESLTKPAPDAYGEDVLELGNNDMMDSHAHGALPQPAFGAVEDDEDEAIEAVSAEDTVSEAPAGPRVDALGNPLGGFAASDDETGYGEESDDSFDSGIKTAADYGLPEWDDEDEGEDDVDDLVDPLAGDGDEGSSSLVSLVSRGGRNKKSVDLSRNEPAPAIPQAYEGEDVALPPRVPVAYEAEPEAPLEGASEPAAYEDEATEFAIVAEEEAEAPEAIEEPVVEVAAQNVADEPVGAPADEPVESEAEEAAAPAPVEEPVAEIFEEEAEPVVDEESPEGLYDCLAAAREMAQTAQNTEDRSRKALYAAVGRAYDFSLEAENAPEDFDELLVDNGLTFQDRAPMTPVVKLVFGADYDKTRLTEYAAVLMHAHRVGVERGKLATFLREAEGGLKGVVNAERRARKEEQGKPVDDKKAVRPNLAKKLRALETLSLADLDEDGAEFALVMVRRTADGQLEVIGEVPEDVPLVERAARKLLG